MAAPSIYTMRPLLVHTRRFPPRSYRAITIFPFVFYKGAPLTTSELRHETVHLWQQIALLLLPFYLLYLLFWLIGLLLHSDTFLAYRSIPFERSAYRLESHGSPSRTAMAFDWLKCLSRQSFM